MSHLVQDTCELSLESRPLNQISCQSAVHQKHTSSEATSADLFYRTRLHLHKQEVTSETLEAGRSSGLLVNFTRFLMRKLP